MDEIFTYSPVPKPKKKEKKPYKGIQTRKPLRQKPPKEKKDKPNKPEKAVREGIKPPKRAVRNEFTEAEKKKIIKAFGGRECCAQCGNPNIEYHHAKFRSASSAGSGRGVWRNGVPLCNFHHSLCHDDYLYAQKWRDLLEGLYGKHYYMDKWDLWLAGLIENPDNKEYEAYMKKESRAS